MISLRLCLGIVLFGGMLCPMAPVPAAGTIITGDMIESAGISQWHEIGLLTDGWYFGSVDGLTWQRSPRAVYHLAGASGEVYIDGRPVTLDQFDTFCLNRLPVDLSRVDSIRIESYPVIRDGRSVGPGSLEIFTGRPDKTVGMDGYAAFGNETGDPGPYRYTGAKLPNVDRAGEAAGIGGGLMTAFGDIGLSGSWSRFFPTDAAVYERNIAIYGHYPRQDIYTGALVFRYRSPKFPIDIRAGFSRLDDFFFAPAVGREIPVRQKHYNFSLAGAIKTSSAINLEYMFGWQLNEPAYRENILNLDFDWRLHRITGDIKLTVSGGRLSGTVGAELISLLPQTAYGLDNESVTRGEMYGSLELNISARLDLKTALAISRADNNTGLTGITDITWTTGTGSFLKLAATVTRQLPVDRGGFAYWTGRGYDFWVDHGGLVEADITVDPDDYFSLDLIGRTGPGSFLSGTADVFIRRGENINFEIFDSEPIENDRLSLPWLAVTDDQQAFIAGFRLGGEIEYSDRLSQNVSYRYQDEFDSDRLFSARWQRIPRHEIQSRLVYRPRPGFTIMALIRYRGRMVFEEFRQYGLTIGRPDLYRLNETYLLDLSARKLFCGRRLSAGLAVRNLFNERYRYHPLGAYFDLSYFVRVAWRPGGF